MKDEKPEMTDSLSTLHPSSPDSPINVALLGFGNVGRAFARYTISDDLINIRAVADSSGGVIFNEAQQISRLIAHKDSGGMVRDFAALSGNPSGASTAGRPYIGNARGSFFPDAQEFIASLITTDTRVLVESLPTNLADGQPALALINAALAAGLHVVTVDKGPLAHGFDELQATAQASGVRLGYSGTTGVNIPDQISDDRVLEIRGVLNGTTNYILTEMQERGMSFADALANAQANGIAEPDPSLDVNGWDTAVKMLILAKTLMRAKATLNQISRIGISAETDALIRVGRQSGRLVRLVGRARMWQGRVRVSVAPKLIGPESPFYAVNGTSKLAMFRTAEKGEVIARARSGRDVISQTIVDDLCKIFS
jgi:homoserine dehydrogenase